MLKENVRTLWMCVAVAGAFVSVGGICLTIGGLLLIEYDLTKLGVGMIVVGTLTYVTILNRIGQD
ncbi:DUF2964 family protein [Burkholderia sp. L27(2015)]|uniref:DUF2964 family protein n=1 Tax=Burkholderia sp. L27(2015) TaxID=1641858 RepID=UPI00131D2805|nr:DUF2964 family protein [Burkholderia sp. L27(2015)]